MVSDPLTDGWYHRFRPNPGERAMLIVCPSCATTYRIELSTLGASERSVRCVRCKNVWFASADAIPATLELPVGLRSVGRTIAPNQALEQGDEAVQPGSVAAGADGATDAQLAEWSAGEPADAPAISVVAADAPSVVPPMAQDPMPLPDGSKAALGEDIETSAARREGVQRAKRHRPRSPAWRPGLPTVILTLVAILASLVNWRVTAVRLLPQTASLFAAVGLPANVRGLAFENVRTSVELYEGKAMLVIEGAVVNITARTAEVPRLMLAVRNGAGYEVYAWPGSPTGSGRAPALGPGDKLAFSTRLASPPPDAREVIVRFFNRRDAMAGLR